MSSSALRSTSPLNVDSQRPSSSTDVSNGVVSPHTRDNSIPRRAGRNSQRVLQPCHDALRCLVSASSRAAAPTQWTQILAVRVHYSQRTAVRVCNSGNVAIYCVRTRYHLVRIASTSPGARPELTRPTPTSRKRTFGGYEQSARDGHDTSYETIRNAVR
ncbi:hypothetical protein DFH06DRAFT_1484530, partial [Mycena polygramma]